MFGQDGWILASFFFCEFMDLDFVSVHKHGKKGLDQYPVILTSHLVNNPYVLQTQSQHDFKNMVINLDMIAFVTALSYYMHMVNLRDYTLLYSLLKLKS